MDLILIISRQSKIMTIELRVNIPVGTVNIVDVADGFSVMTAVGIVVGNGVGAVVVVADGTGGHVGVVALMI
jgi:hypothetical protein